MINPGAAPSMPPLTPKPGTNQTGQGGQALPPYLQMRKPAAPGSPVGTTPTLTPSSTGTPGEVTNRGTTSNPAPTGPVQQPPASTAAPMAAATPAQGSSGAPPLTPASATSPQAGGSDLASTYNFFKSDLQNQAKQAKANAISDASARGVYYGTPLTGSEADIDTQLQRGIGQLGAGMYANQQQGDLTRLALGSNLLNSTPGASPGAMDPNVFSALGGLFGQSGPLAAARKAPITPAGGQQVTPGMPVGQGAF